MIMWLHHLWKRLRGSLWFLPGSMSLGALGLAMACARLDAAVANWDSLSTFLYHGSPQSARLLLSTVAGSMITVAGVSFSVTMVALSLASSQLGPRLLGNFMRDQGNQVVLGGFIATFLFCLLSLGSAPQQQDAFMSISVSMALLLAVVSLFLFIYFIHHIASSLQADHVVQSVAADLRKHLELIFPDNPDAEEETADSGGLQSNTDRASLEVHAPETGYVQAVDEGGLVELAEKHDLWLHVLCRAGDFVTRGCEVIRVAGSETLDAELQKRLQNALIISGNRTADQDPEFGVHQLVEIALRALSPGINDPFTAIACIDHLSGIMAEIADRSERAPWRQDSQNRRRLCLDTIEFGGVLGAAFDQIRQNAGGSPAVVIRLLEGLRRIAETTQRENRHSAIRTQAVMIYEANADRLHGHDLEALDERMDALNRTLAMRDVMQAGTSVPE